MNTHINIPFKLSDESINWFKEHTEKIYTEFDRVYPETGGFWFNNPHEPGAILFQSTPPALEVKRFLAGLGLSNTYIHYLIYKPNNREKQMLQLHIDAPQFIVLPARFNILIEGNDNSSIHWWNHGVDSDKVKLENISVGKGKRWQVLGATSAEQLNLIGAPDVTSHTLSSVQKTADFVRTNIIHAIEKDGSRRFILSARIHHPWEEILEKIKNV
jgi:hypothetical protein